MPYCNSLPEIFLGTLIILSSAGVLLLKKPVHACLSFLLTLLSLAALYLQLSAPFIAVMQVLVYAGAILVIFMFVIVLFQDAHAYIIRFRPNSTTLLLTSSASLFVVTLGMIGFHLLGITARLPSLVKGFGEAEYIGKALYVDFFFPFEIVAVLFLTAVVGALYIGKR